MILTVSFVSKSNIYFMTTTVSFVSKSNIHFTTMTVSFVSDIHYAYFMVRMEL